MEQELLPQASLVGTTIGVVLYGETPVVKMCKKLSDTKIPSFSNKVFVALKIEVIYATVLTPFKKYMS
jgi:hypothetical protein